MKIKSTLLACTLIALAGCASDRSTSMDNGGGTASSDSTSNMGTGSTASTVDQSPPVTASPETRGSTSMAQTGSPGSGVVQTIDQITRQDATSMGLSAGAAAAGGSLGSPSDKIYRVTVRMDDGTTQTVLAESMPSYKSGDRVRYANGSVTRDSQ